MINIGEGDFFLGGVRVEEDEFRQENLGTVRSTTPQGNGLRIASLRDTVLPSGHGRSREPSACLGERRHDLARS